MRTPHIEVTPKVELAIFKTLTRVGVPTHLSGYEYLKVGIGLLLENPFLINQVTKRLYPGIAELTDSRPSRVERCIRHAVESTFTRNYIDHIKEVFGATPGMGKGKLTNSEFMSQVAEMVRLEVGVYGL